MNPMVLLKDIPEIRMKVFGDDKGEVHFITDEMCDFVYVGERNELLDMTGAGVIHVKNCTSVRLPISPPVAFRPVDDPAKLTDYRYVDIPLQQYNLYGHFGIRTGFYKDRDRAVWVVKD